MNNYGGKSPGDFLGFYFGEHEHVCAFKGETTDKSQFVIVKIANKMWGFGKFLCILHRKVLIISLTEYPFKKRIFIKKKEILKISINLRRFLI